MTAGEAVGAQDCVDCHMPLSGVFDVAEVRIHDHFIRVDISTAQGPRLPGTLRFPESPEGEWRRFEWPGVPAPDHIDDPGLWLMAYAHGDHGLSAMELIDTPAGPTALRLPMYHHVRGSLLELAGRAEEAVLAYERALELDPDLAPSAINLGLLLGEGARQAEGLELLDAVIERHPRLAPALRNRALLRYRRGDREGFISDLMRAFEAEPRGHLAATLADAFREVGDLDAARRWMDLARQLDPPAPSTR